MVFPILVLLHRHIILPLQHPLTNLTQIPRPQRVLCNPTHTLLDHRRRQLGHMNPRRRSKLCENGSGCGCLWMAGSFNVSGLADGDLDIIVVFGEV
jgi:hypothetical protein